MSGQKILPDGKWHCPGSYTEPYSDRQLFHYGLIILRMNNPEALRTEQSRLNDYAGATKEFWQMQEVDRG